MTLLDIRKRIGRFAVLLGLIGVLSAFGVETGNAGTPIQVYGVWHAGNDACIWGTDRTVTEFDQKNNWLIKGADGRPSVNLVILSFVHPLKLLNGTTDSTTFNGVPRGMTTNIVNYFRTNDIRVMLSIGGITYVKPWDQAMATSAKATVLGQKAAALAQEFGVGIEIDYEGDSATTIANMQYFIDAYRALLPYDATGADHAARLTIDLAAGDRWLIALATKSTRDWLTPRNPVLDYANAMVPSKQPSVSAAQSSWQEHITGNSRMSPPIPPLAPAKLTGSLYLTGRKVTPECSNFSQSVQLGTANFVETVNPNGVGTTPGMLGYMFWAAECEGTRSQCTTPPNTCDGGLGVGAQVLDIPIPMPPLRQE